MANGRLSISIGPPVEELSMKRHVHNHSFKDPVCRMGIDKLSAKPARTPGKILIKVLSHIPKTQRRAV